MLRISPRVAPISRLVRRIEPIQKKDTDKPSVVEDTQLLEESTLQDAAQTNLISFPSEKERESFEGRLTELRTLAEELSVHQEDIAEADWDQGIFMPKKASDGRAHRMAVVEKMYHEKLISRRTLRLIEYFNQEGMLERLNDIDKELLKTIKSRYETAKSKPSWLIKKIEELESKSREIIERARKAKDFSIIAPHLKEIIELKRKEAEYAGYKGSPYNALIDDFEDGMTTNELDKLFDLIKREMILVIKAVREQQIKKAEADKEAKTDEEDNAKDFLSKSYSKGKLLALCKDLAEYIGFDLDAGRIDPFEGSAAFCTKVGPNDVRIGISLDADLNGVISYILHEAGHGLYAQGIDPAISGSLLDEAPSTGIDESQAKLYECIVGQGLAFWIHYFPKLQERFPVQLEDITLEDFYKAINTTEITVGSNDSEIAFDMHNILRYEIERDLIEGNIEVEDLPKVWNQKMRDYFGIVPEDDADGVLLDDHWYTGYLGYFPTYTLGTIYAAQIYSIAKKEIPDLELKIASGNMKELNTWLQEKVYKYGALEDAKDILQRVTGEPLNPKYLIDYLKDKYTKLTGIDLNNIEE